MASPIDPQKKTTPHDRFFRAAMKPSVTLEFINTHLPASIKSQIDPGSLKIAPGTFVGEDLDEWKTDILYQATFQGNIGYIYILVEHQRKVDTLMPLRMLEYILKIIRAHIHEHPGGKLPLVYPCVIYNGAKPYTATTDIFELFEDSTLARDLFLKPFQLVDLTRICDEDLKKTPLIGIVELFLKHAFVRDLISFIRKHSDLLKQVEEREEIRLLEASVQYIFETNKEGLRKQDILTEFKKHLSPITQTTIMTIAEAFIAEGREEGREEGLLQGIKKGHLEGVREGQAQQLLRLLEKRFKVSISDSYIQLIEQADSQILGVWAENVMDATKIEDVFSAKFCAS